MPYSIVHLELANKKIKEKKDLTEENILDFFVWSLIVDSSYDLEKYWIKNIKRDDTHYHKWEEYLKSNFPKNFLDIELKNNKNNYLKLGYYYHLLVDKVWRDNEVSNTKEENTQFRYIYQISRKIHAFYDLENFLHLENGQNIIDNLYNYKIDKNKYPSIFNNIEEKILKQVLKDILDYMTRKKTFF